MSVQIQFVKDRSKNASRLHKTRICFRLQNLVRRLGIQKRKERHPRGQFRQNRENQPVGVLCVQVVPIHALRSHKSEQLVQMQGSAVRHLCFQHDLVHIVPLHHFPHAQLHQLLGQAFPSECRIYHQHANIPTHAHLSMRLDFGDDHAYDGVGPFGTEQEAVLGPLVEKVPVDVDGVRFRKMVGYKVWNRLKLYFVLDVERMVAETILGIVHLGHGWRKNGGGRYREARVRGGKRLGRRKRQKRDQKKARKRDRRKDRSRRG